MVQEAADLHTPPARLEELSKIRNSRLLSKNLTSSREVWSLTERVVRSALRNPSLPPGRLLNRLSVGSIDAWANPLAPLVLMGHPEVTAKASISLATSARFDWREMPPDAETIVRRSYPTLVQGLREWWSTTDDAPEMIKWLNLSVWRSNRRHRPRWRQAPWPAQKLLMRGLLAALEPILAHVQDALALEALAYVRTWSTTEQKTVWRGPSVKRLMRLDKRVEEAAQASSTHVLSVCDGDATNEEKEAAIADDIAKSIRHFCVASVTSLVLVCLAKRRPATVFAAVAWAYHLTEPPAYHLVPSNGKPTPHVAQVRPYDRVNGVVAACIRRVVSFEEAMHTVGIRIGNRWIREASPSTADLAQERLETSSERTTS